MTYVVLHYPWKLLLCAESENVSVSMDNVDLRMRSEIRYPWIILNYIKTIIFCEEVA